MTTATREGRLVAAFARLADALVGEYDVFDLLQHLVDTCRDLLDVEAVGLLLMDADAGGLDVVASTSESSRLVEAMQLGAEAGPCIEAFETGRVVSEPDVRRLPDRWSTFRTSALEAGFLSVCAVPMRLRTTTIGALNLFGAEVGGLAEPDVAVAQALADVATIGVVHARAARAADEVQAQLQLALDSRVVIEQAKGVLATSRGVGMDEAFALLRDHARSTRSPIREVAQGLVDRTLTL